MCQVLICWQWVPGNLQGTGAINYSTNSGLELLREAQWQPHSASSASCQLCALGHVSNLSEFPLPV